MAPATVGGFLGQRLDLWRTHRLPRVGEDAFLLQGFERPPGQHVWQGEHVGKWIHATTLACVAAPDPKRQALLHQTVARLIATQAPDGYLGTYLPANRFDNPRDPKARGSWDVWTHRYVLYGLLVYDRHFPDPNAVAACVRIGDLLLRTFGPGARALNEVGTRAGLSSATVLESIVMLYERTGEERFLRLAEHLAEGVERNPALRPTDAMREGLGVTVCGDGKAYQLMAVMLGYAELYHHTRRRDYLETAIKVWEQIREHHTYVTGGPWSYAAVPAQNAECFAPPSFFHPTNCVETCSTTTWVQLSLRLWRQTGEARFATEAERAMLNHLVGAQSPNGTDWAYHTMPNAPSRGYESAITCCASSGPRALELYARHLAATGSGALVVNSYLPAVVGLDSKLGAAGRFVIEGRYPFEPQAALRGELTQPAELTLHFRLPAGVTAMDVVVGGQPQALRPTPAGYLELKRTWRPGEKAVVRFEFPLRAHFQTGRDGVRWVAFTWGPLTLAQDVVRQVDQPEVVLALDEKNADPAAWLRPVTPARDDGLPRWRLTAAGHRNVILQPYGSIGASGGAVRTMFPNHR
ncbi:MAG: glycoside hydrolase family 127 protein [Verrucomicrobia bacterium]|nr:glycoside hydrolase family 127 protein [Verrucomicrobiota bacterium]